VLIVFFNAFAAAAFGRPGIASRKTRQRAILIVHIDSAAAWDRVQVSAG
jgi:hypothetical protein